MLPGVHILYGVLFSAIVWVVVPSINPLYIGLLFLSTFLIDFDHYLCCALKTRKLGIFHSFSYHRELRNKLKNNRDKGIRETGDFHIFHTIEIHILIGILGFTWIGFFYIFLGMVFHSLLDIASMLYDDFMYVREFSLIRWLLR